MKLLDILALIVTLLCRVAAWPPSNERNSGWYGRSNSYGHPRCHGTNFVPDQVLHLTYENVSIGCQTRTSVLINGSLPGPVLRLKPGQTSWIRVYNDMTDFNATIVSFP